MLRRLSVAVAISVCAFGPLVSAQVVIEEFNEVTEELAEFSLAANLNPGQRQDEGSAPVGRGPRLQRLKTLEYDRRPSAILKAWATPPGAEAAAKKAEDAEPPAAPEVTTTPPPKTPAEAAAIEEAKKKAAEAAAKAAADAKALDLELATLSRNVTLGEWPAVKAYFKTLAKAEAKVAYDRLLVSLKTGVQRQPPGPPQGQAQREKNRFDPGDVVALVDLAPEAVSEAQFESLGAIFRQALDAGHRVEGFVAAIGPRLGTEGFPLDRRKLARLLVSAGEPVLAGEFLPTVEEAEKTDDREGLNLLARHFLARYDKERKMVWAESAWKATQAVLATGAVNADARDEAITRAVDLAPRLRAELGQAWLDESFASRPERGMEILASIGAGVSTGLQSRPMDAEARLKLLEVQTTAAKALLAAAPERAREWASKLELLAANWLREAEFSYRFDTATTLGPRMQRDAYGNIYWFDEDGEPQMGPRGNAPRAISAGKVLAIRPAASWLGLVSATLRPRFDTVFAQLYLKVGEEAQAFPYVESLAQTHPKPAKELVDEFLRVWTRNHDPNTARSRTNEYMFVYGFEQRAAGIPLTRSKQERNLKELAEWMKRLRGLPVELDQKLVARAFTAAHGAAEVFRLEEVEKIFGPLGKIEPETLGELLEGMRRNLAQLWRDAAVQERNKTRRFQPDIEAEVLRGYALATTTLERAATAHPRSSAIARVTAAIAHDENEYRTSLKKDSGYSERRSRAFQLFRRAAELYAAELPGLDADERAVDVYETWFYAALGASDLRLVNHEKVLAAGEIPKIRAALQALPGDAAKWHLDTFANNLFSRMGTAAPAVKFRYVREGLAIVGDNERAVEARRVFDYYNDLVTEIRLVTSVDGTPRVGAARPFGIRVDLRHTKEIERESGGFGKYLQNQNAVNFSYNYGRPTEDYRDKFETAAREALQENFEVLSVTFNAPEAKSKATEEYGWRVTPYAYLLVKARGEEVDRVPPLRLDLDFLDTSGYAILPVESPVLPIDAKNAVAEARPFEDLKITQTLDERHVKDGKLLLEVKASAFGLVPELDRLVTLEPAGFEVAGTEDGGLSVSKLDEESGGGRVVSERHWTVTLRAKDGAPPPKTFSFGAAKVTPLTLEHFRYDDADLAAVDATVTLNETFGRKRNTGLWIAIGGGLAVIATLSVIFLSRRRPSAAAAAAKTRIPATLTPFTVLGMLRDLERDGVVPAERRAELAVEIRRLETHYFDAAAVETPDLARVVGNWAPGATAEPGAIAAPH